MAVAMKGIMKGIRYITSMFEHEREPEIEIGGPTEVKHVAHIGWDGPTANAPSWMDQFKGEGEDPGAALQQDSRGLPEVGESPNKPRGKGGKQGAGGSEGQHGKPSRKKKAKGSTSQQSSGSAGSNKKAKGRQAQAE